MKRRLIRVLRCRGVAVGGLVEILFEGRDEVGEGREIGHGGN